MANKVYAAIETPITVKSSGGDATITPTSVANGAGRISSRYDRGATSKPALYRLTCRFKTTASATLGRTLRLYAITADAATAGTYTDDTWTETDQAVSSEDLLRNSWPMGVVVCNAASVGPFAGSGLVEIRSRYVQFAFFNDTAQSMSATAGDFELVLTPVPDEIQ